jgi:DtxR family Mn-dependent transcriptional regulator
MVSYTEENYLKAIYKLSEKSGEGITTNAIAESLDIKAGSVTDMLKKLSEKELIHYAKYTGVELTQKGRQTAIKIVRKHRLWEVFLVEKLDFKWDQVHPMAEELEHINFDELIERLDAFLGHPKFDPHGDPIPNRKGEFQPFTSIRLSEASVEMPLLMTGIDNHTNAFLQYLDKNGLALGCKIVILEITPFDKSLLITINRDKQVHISHEVAKNILVTAKDN